MQFSVHARFSLYYYSVEQYIYFQGEGLGDWLILWSLMLNQIFSKKLTRSFPCLVAIKLWQEAYQK